MTRKHEIKVIPPAEGTSVYPTVPTYAFGEFAGPVIEFGGYGDATLVDPWTGRRLWVSDACGEDPDVKTTDIIRRLADAADEVGFFDEADLGG